MIVAGVDVGSLTAKAVIMKDNEIIASAVLRANPSPGQSAREVMDMALAQAGLSQADIEFTVGTGYGRKQIDFVNLVESEIACHARGAVWNMPSVRSIIDIGGQDAKAARIDENGNVERYGYNDKCASGTGRFLEVMAEALEVPLEDMGDLDLKATEDLSISNQCVVFAETEVISLVNKGYEVPDIAKALHKAMAGRVAALAKSIGVEEDIAFTGGVAKNKGLARALANALNMDLKFLDTDPQTNGALGAALMASQVMAEKKSA
ncbi:CoA-substrate-specific enzyme activase [Desulfatibacillum aliphaticivorans]|uniref:CoA-substrate-specific enzyme activase n=1 Tax=Desulfatibacillum aliphaticivorans TaxID=218208 RepID=B8FDE3_DESAL|nr:acyl-CoA dehydratase activase [Desulfatibacillum aliphaticivorans]ACL06574.1 CoA-substrate-specific enzyme activase [Desulfatibacillum aliphaticivorans]